MADLQKTLKVLQSVAYRRKFWKLDLYKPYPKQLEFHNLGATKTDRLFMAGNQVGKTWAGAFETAFHMTGLYPDWWQGRRFEQAVKCTASGESSLLVRKTQQKLLCGEPGVE